MSLRARGVLAGGIAAVILALTAAPSAQAANARYSVLKCHRYSSQTQGGQDAQVTLERRGPYSAYESCLSGGAYELRNTGPGAGGQGARVYITAPAGTAIASFSMRIDMRTSDRINADIAVVDFAGRPTVVYRAPNAPGLFQEYSRDGLWHRQVVIDMYCSDAGGCSSSSAAHAFAQDVEIVLADTSDPVPTSPSGSLLAGGWRGGAQELTASGVDSGSGIEGLAAYVNGVEVGRAPTSCPGAIGTYAAIFVPCSAGAALDIDRNTATAPFRDGANTVQVRAEDFAGNAVWSASRTVMVDNSGPQLAFTNHQDPDDPELIRAPVSDAYSGVASGRLFYRAAGAAIWQPLETRVRGGELEARVDSAAYPEGEYEFRAEAADVAGNATETTLRADGEPMRLTFPLRRTVELSAFLEPGRSQRLTVAYRREAAVAGRLLDSDGDPLADKQITVVEDLGQGALIDKRVRTVSTDSDGGWQSTLPGGPSRQVSAHFAGTKRYLTDTRQAGDLRVRGQTKFEAERRRVKEGARAVFAGKVGHYAARVPPGGKLVELQVQESTGVWNTVREAFYTRPSGRFRIGYRFGRFYRADTSFRFRIKVAREQGWPYKAPARSVARKIVVLAG